MAGFGVAFSIPMLLLLPHAAVGASLSASESVIRREAAETVIRHEAGPSRVMKSMSITPSGELLQSMPDTEASVDDFCDVDYADGIEASSDCAVNNGQHGVNHSPITSEIMCRSAAKQAGGRTLQDMTITSNYQHSRPHGCFKQPCSEAVPAVGGTGMCYFFNNNRGTQGTHGQTIVGTPVCQRARYLNYVLPDTDTGDAGCPVGYRLIQKMYPCREAQNCLGAEPGDQFRIGMKNASRHLDYPLGCFRDKVDHKFYLNEPSQMPKGTSVTGTLICKVKVSSRDETLFSSKQQNKRCKNKSEGGTRVQIAGAKTAEECKNDCAEDPSCKAADFNGNTMTCHSCLAGFELRENEGSETWTKNATTVARHS